MYHLDYDSIKPSIDEYFKNQKHKCASKTLAKRVSVAPKQMRYILKTFYSEYMVHDKLSKKIYYLNSKNI